MESWTARKRPWEDDSPTTLPLKRRGSINSVAPVSLSPLPRQAGYHSRDGQIQNHRRLPPLQTSISNKSAESVTLCPERTCLEAQLSEPPHARPRSQSLADIFHAADCQKTQVQTEIPPHLVWTPELTRSSPPHAAEEDRPPSSLNRSPSATGAVSCCRPRCEGQECSVIRTLIQKVATEVVLLGDRVNKITQTEHYSPDQLLQLRHLDNNKALRYALEVVQWTSLRLQEHLHHQPPRSPYSLHQQDTSSIMRRGQHHLEGREEQPPPARQPSLPRYAYYMAADENRRHPSTAEATSPMNSPQLTASSFGSVLMPPQSPMQAPQPIRTAMLPSPSSLHFPTAPTFASMSPPAQASVQSAHLQDLQHQISLKTLAFQTLQREYDSLLQKLERQRAKCTTLEKKFEVSDVEINSLTDEKEKLQVQVGALEAQVDDLQQSRDEARKQLVANGAQYMRIMEMANRLEAQGAEDKKKWEAEKSRLEQRICLLEEAMVVGTEKLPPEAEPCDDTSLSVPNSVSSQQIAPANSSQTETIILLRVEVGRLRSRTQTLETALHTMRQESITVQAAARQLVESSGRLGDIAQHAGQSEV